MEQQEKKSVFSPAQQSIICLTVLGSLALVCLMTLILFDIKDTAVLLPFGGAIGLIINSISSLTQIKE
jgi:hypothetical protein